MRYFPLFVDFQDRHVLVVGGGERAAQKLRLLSKTGARITVLAKEFSAQVLAIANERPLSLQQRSFVPSDVEGNVLVVGAEDDEDRNRQVAAAASARSIPTNIVDAPDLSSVIFPAIVDRDPVVVAIGTEGAAPIIGRDLRARIEAWLPATFGRIASRAASLRPRVRNLVADPRARRQFWERLLRGPFRDCATAGDAAGAERAVEREFAIATSDTIPTGSVALIGCGPGDPDLLTLKALQRLQDADVLVYDRLVNPAILDYARRDAIRIDVGKSAGLASPSQDEISRILVRESLKGNRVARLKGGDPLIFGRAAEEIAAVRAAGIDVEIIPGITAAHACAAAVGLPLTLRGKVRQFSIVTGTTETGRPELDWPALSADGHAVAIYMGVRNAAQIETELRSGGMPEQTSIVIVENGTRDNQRAVATTLENLSAAVATEQVRGPAIIFAGLDWADANLSRPANVKTFEPRQVAQPSSIRLPQTGVARVGRRA